MDELVHILNTCKIQVIPYDHRKTLVRSDFGTYLGTPMENENIEFADGGLYSNAMGQLSLHHDIEDYAVLYTNVNMSDFKETNESWNRKIWADVLYVNGEMYPLSNKRWVSSNQDKINSLYNGTIKMVDALFVSINIRCRIRMLF